MPRASIPPPARMRRPAPPQTGPAGEAADKRTIAVFLRVRRLRSLGVLLGRAPVGPAVRSRHAEAM
eukprot:11170708-Lingulodinium_polyedra.AAC.1